LEVVSTWSHELLVPGIRNPALFSAYVYCLPPTLSCPRLLVFQPARGLSASGGFIRLGRVYSPLASLPVRQRRMNLWLAGKLFSLSALSPFPTFFRRSGYQRTQRRRRIGYTPDGKLPASVLPVKVQAFFVWKPVGPVLWGWIKGP